MNVLIIATLALGLVVDQHWATWGQVAVSAVVWLLFRQVWHRSDESRRLPLVACLVFATFGEMFLSLVWGLYQYRLGNIPMFVPPGHVLLFFLGMQVSERLPEGAEWWVAAIAGGVVGLFAWTGHDTMGPVLYAFFLACLWISPSRRLYATMFVLSLALELYGTWVGNWVWAYEVPWTPLRQENPPLASGAFYCVLDLLVVSFATYSERRARGSAAGEPRPEAEHRLAPLGDLQRPFVPAVAANDLEAERQAFGAEARGDRHRG